jgi:hypothetical protein
MSDTANGTEEAQIHKATKDVIDRVAGFDNDTRRRIFRRALGFFELDVPQSLGYSHQVSSTKNEHERQHGNVSEISPRFINKEELSPKDFMFRKQPRTDIERVACLAYFLANYRDTRHFKTIDISKLNTEAAQTKISNTAFAVTNATNAGLLVQAGKGRKQLSAIGERYVDALPDRESAKHLLANLRHRRSRPSKGNGDIK